MAWRDAPGCKRSHRPSACLGPEQAGKSQSSAKGSMRQLATLEQTATDQLSTNSEMIQKARERLAVKKTIYKLKLALEMSLYCNHLWSMKIINLFIKPSTLHGQNYMQHVGHEILALLTNTTATSTVISGENTTATNPATTGSNNNFTSSIR